MPSQAAPEFGFGVMYEGPAPRDAERPCCTHPCVKALCVPRAAPARTRGGPLPLAAGPTPRPHPLLGGGADARQAARLLRDHGHRRDFVQQARLAAGRLGIRGVQPGRGWGRRGGISQEEGRARRARPLPPRPPLRAPSKREDHRPQRLQGGSPDAAVEQCSVEIAHERADVPNKGGAQHRGSGVGQAAPAQTAARQSRGCSLGGVGRGRARWPDRGAVPTGAPTHAGARGWANKGPLPPLGSKRGTCMSRALPPFEALSGSPSGRGPTERCCPGARGRGAGAGGVARAPRLLPRAVAAACSGGAAAPPRPLAACGNGLLLLKVSKPLPHAARGRGGAAAPPLHCKARGLAWLPL
jgi:hypothetical protein